MATSMSCTKFGGTLSRPRHTSPNSPPPKIHLNLLTEIYKKKNNLPIMASIVI